MGSCSSVDEMSGQERTVANKTMSKNELAEWVNNNIEDSSNSFENDRTIGKRNSIHGRTLNEHIKNIDATMNGIVNNKLRNPVAQTQDGVHKYFVPVAVVPTESVPVKNDKKDDDSSSYYYSSSSETDTDFKSSDFSSY